MIMENRFYNLTAYQEAKQLVLKVYSLMRLFPPCEQYALCDQLRRAVISIPSNIAEGMGRYSEKEQVHFLEIAYGSLMEVNSQLDIAKDLKYITQEQFTDAEQQIYRVASLVSGLRSKRVKTLAPSL